ncbi:PREDICTED: U-box domain-containing protein 32 isoform X2 [Tarenaya hassleriana]|nr:PREDICTED: U-box domain-containing protein 32 isoform X2 [Tarenaya hassleriana]
MGAASDKHYSWKMTDLKSKKAIFVCQRAPVSCHIWFLCKGYLIFTRATNEDSTNRESRPPLVQRDSDAETRKSENLESSYMMRRLRYWRSLLEQDADKDTGELEKEAGSSIPRVSSGSSSSVGELVAPEPVGLDTATKLTDEEVKCDQEVVHKVHHKYDKFNNAMDQAERTIYEEAGNKQKEDDSTFEAICKSKALESLCMKEMSRRKKLEELLGREKEDVKKVMDQHDNFKKELKMVQGQNLQLENQIRKIRDMEKEYDEKFVTAMELLKSFKQKRDEMQIEHGKAVREVNELRKLVKGESENSRGTQILEYSFMELNEATNEFDPSWKLGEGNYGSIYKGYLQHIQVAVKMLPSYGSQNHLEFQHQVEILSRVRHPNLVTLMGACTESQSLIYQYIENGSLEDRLSTRHNIPPLSWETRIRIASEICSALLFLHSNMPCIIHGNLKPSKILLDSYLVTKTTDYGISQLIPEVKINKPVHVDPNFFVSGRLTPELDVYSFGIILLQLLTRRPVSGILRDVKCALENDNFGAVLDSSAGDWPVARARKLANVAMRCCKKNPLNRPDLSVVLRVIERMRVPENLSSSSSTPSYSDHKVPRRAPSHFLCPIFQEVMKDPLIAADGFTYEAEAIREWLVNGHDTSPMTNLTMEDCNLIPNRALQQAIQDWQNRW